jgi:hypothetical protein
VGCHKRRRRDEESWAAAAGIIEAYYRLLVMKRKMTMKWILPALFLVAFLAVACTSGGPADKTAPGGR